jgi:hypothetical protein
MANKGQSGGRGRRPGVVTAAKRGGPGRGFWVALGAVALLGIAALSWLASRPKNQVSQIDPTLPASSAISSAPPADSSRPSLSPTFARG